MKNKVGRNGSGKPREVKVVVLGDSGVGKSSLVLRFATNTFKPFSESTIGASFVSKTVNLEDGSPPVKFQVWDTAGQEKYHSLAPMYYRGAAAAIITFDITATSSFTTLQTWVRELKSLGPENIVLAIAGNKVDLEHKRQVSMDIAKRYAEEVSAIYLETSAKTNSNVSALFSEITRRLPQPPRTTEVARAAGVLHDGLLSSTPDQKKCC